jgi:cell wall-associated NlpC family hydrolase
MSPSKDQPSPEELAAIIAAVEVAWPHPVAAAAPSARRLPWRWSGRWWASDRPVAAERRRPS